MTDRNYKRRKGRPRLIWTENAKKGVTHAGIRNWISKVKGWLGNLC